METKEMKDYRAWVKKEGHITASASSVLKEYIKSKGLSNEEYKQLAKELRF